MVTDLGPGKLAISTHFLPYFRGSRQSVAQIRRRAQPIAGKRPYGVGGERLAAMIPALLPPLTSASHPVGDVARDKCTVGAGSWSRRQARWHAQPRLVQERQRV